MTPRPGAPGSRAALLEALGVHGLEAFDAPLLAALATRTPLLLIGPHGSAKSALLERLAHALGLEHRHYNASLIAFDDLAGFPVPDGDGLRYLRTPATLWDAESVLVDEINRCRPDVQNKLFPIIHEAKLQGMALPRLRYRWAAMNPPPVFDADSDAEASAAQGYLGAMPLDAALADRFGCVLTLPGLDALSPRARRAVIASGLPAPAPAPVLADADPVGDSHASHRAAGWPALDLPGLVAACERRLGAAPEADREWIVAWVDALVGPARDAGLPLSGRRVAMLAGLVLAVAAARETLGESSGEAQSLHEAAREALGCGLPHAACGRRLEPGVLEALHRYATTAADAACTPRLQGGESATAAGARAAATVRALLDLPTPLERLAAALALRSGDAPLRRAQPSVSVELMSMLVSDALAAQAGQRRWLLARALLPRLLDTGWVDPATLEQLVPPFAAQLSVEMRSQSRASVPVRLLPTLDALMAHVTACPRKDRAAAALANCAAALFVEDPTALDVPALVRDATAIAHALEVA